jgi:hypothetical protein
VWEAFGRAGSSHVMYVRDFQLQDVPEEKPVNIAAGKLG